MGLQYMECVVPYVVNAGSSVQQSKTFDWFFPINYLLHICKPMHVKKKKIEL